MSCNDGSNTNDTNICIKGGLVCIEHFADTDLIGKKRKILRSDAIPSIFPSNSENIRSRTNDPHGTTKPAETIELIELCEPNGFTPEDDLDLREVYQDECRECKQKDKTINNLRDKILSMQAKMNSLRQVTNKWRQKSYHLERMKSKLDDAVIHMQKEKIINSKFAKKIGGELNCTIATKSIFSLLHNF